MKRSVDWHKECLDNSRQTLQHYRKEVLFLQEKIARHEKDLLVRHSQIIEAELRGVTEFDADKFGLKRSTK